MQRRFVTPEREPYSLLGIDSYARPSGDAFWVLLAIRLAFGAIVAALVVFAILVGANAVGYLTQRLVIGASPSIPTLAEGVLGLMFAHLLGFAFAGLVCLTCLVSFPLAAWALTPAFVHANQSRSGQLIGGAIATTAVAPLWVVTYATESPWGAGVVGPLLLVTAPTLVILQAAGATVGPAHALRSGRGGKRRVRLSELFFVVTAIATAFGMARVASGWAGGAVVLVASSAAIQAVTHRSVAAAVRTSLRRRIAKRRRAWRKALGRST